jgi:glycosyltransferase involved in cell wall biosynthesis
MVRPRVLFIASSFPPARLPGSPRTWSIATRLEEQGWDVTVVTTHARQWLHPDGGPAAQGTIRRADVWHDWAFLQTDLLRLPRRMPRLAARVLRRIAMAAGVDKHIGWTRALTRRCAAFKPGDFDVVLVSAPPFSSFPVAMRTAERLGIPFVADYRDLWTLNPMRSNAPDARHVQAERAVTSNAAAITTISPSSAQALAETFGVGAKTHVLTNGFDLRQIGDTAPAHYDHFAIVYAGTFYLPQRPVTPLVAALALVESRNMIDGPWRFHYYGPQSDHVIAAAAEAGLPRHRFECHGSVSRREALAATAGAGLVTIVTTVEREVTTAGKGVVTGKIFEAIGLGRPMLVVAPHGSDVEEIVATAGRGRSIPGSETEEMAAAIAAVAAGDVTPPKTPQSFDWTTLAARLDAILRDVLASKEVA